MGAYGDSCKLQDCTTFHRLTRRCSAAVIPRERYIQELRKESAT